MENVRISLLLPCSLCPCPRTRGKPTTTTTTTTMMMLVVACQRQLSPFNDLSRGLATTSHVTRVTCHATYRPGDMSPALSYTVRQRRGVINCLVSRQQRWQLKTLRPCLMYNDNNSH